MIIIIISHLLHENKSQVLTIQMADMQMEQARSYELIQGLVPKSRVSIYILYIMSACAACVAVMNNYKHTLK